MDDLELSVVQRNKAIRGYIMRALARGHQHTLMLRQVVNNLINEGLIVSPDITVFLNYLVDSGYIKFVNQNIKSYNIYRQDASIRLTPDGEKLIAGVIEDPMVEI